MPEARGALSPSVLLALGVVSLAIGEFSVWPVTDPGFNSAGWWSATGNALLLLLVGILLVGVVRPIRARLARSLGPRALRGLFGAGVAGATFAWAWGGSMVALGSPSVGTASTAFSFLPSLSPFGFLPTVEFEFGAGRFSGFISPMLFVYALLAYLSCAAIALAVRPGHPPGTPAAPAGRRRAAATAALSWIPPLGLSVSCCTTPVLLSILVLAGGSVAIVPFSGQLASVSNGLLVVTGLWLALTGIWFATRAPSGTPGVRTAPAPAGRAT